MSEDNKKGKLNIRLAWGKPTKVGYWSEDIGPKEYDAIQSIEIGGRLSLRKITCKNKETGEEFESSVFEYMTPDQVKAFKGNKKPSKPRSDDQDF